MEVGVQKWDDLKCMTMESRIRKPFKEIFAGITKKNKDVRYKLWLQKNKRKLSYRDDERDGGGGRGNENSVTEQTRMNMEIWNWCVCALLLFLL